MGIINVYSSNVKYFYRVRVCSVSAIIVLIATLFCLFTPIYFIHHTGGFWIRTRTYWEKPNVHFKHKYFLLIEQDNANPLVCSTFSHYKDNLINDDCHVVKVKELDNDKNTIQDSLHFEASFFTNRPITTVMLLLFFHYELREHIRVTVEAMTAIEHTVNREAQELHLVGDLELHQNGVLLHDGIYHADDNSTDINGSTLIDLLIENSNRLLSGKVSNLRAVTNFGFIDDEPITIKADIFYSTQSIKYQPGFWEEIKWAWMQYVAVFIVVAYFVRRSLTRMFAAKSLRSFVVVPWQQKS